METEGFPAIKLWSEQGKGCPWWGLLSVQLFELCRTHSSWAWLETTTPGNSLRQSTLRRCHWSLSCLLCKKKKDNFRGLKCRDENPGLNITEMKASRSCKETKGRAELPNLPSRGNVPTMYMTFFSLWLLGFWFCQTKACSGGRRRARGSVEEKEGVKEQREGICLHPQPHHTIYKRGQLIINKLELLGTVT